MSGEWSEGNEYWIKWFGEKAKEDDEKYGEMVEVVMEQFYEFLRVYSYWMSGDYGEEDLKEKMRMVIPELVVELVNFELSLVEEEVNE